MDSKIEFEDEINELLLLDIDELLFQLGEEVSPTLGLLDSDKKHKMINSAKKWLDDNRNKIQKAICGSYTLHYYLNDTEKYERVITVASIVDLISSIKLNISPVVVAVLVFKEGIKSYCSDYKYES